MRRLLKLIVVSALGLGAVLATPAVVSAQAYPGGTTEERKPSDPGDPGDVLGTTAERPAQARPAQVQGVQATRGLAVTGGDIVGLTVLGGGLVAAGTVIVRRSRRPITAPA